MTTPGKKSFLRLLVEVMGCKVHHGSSSSGFCVMQTYGRKQGFVANHVIGIGDAEQHDNNWISLAALPDEQTALLNIIPR
ncbi:MAG: hypothetical protein AB7D51_06615 [Desulfovibrionaceae bacterium]